MFHPYLSPTLPPMRFREKSSQKTHFSVKKRLGKILALRFKILKFLKSITFNDFRFFVTITTSPPPLPHPSPIPTPSPQDFEIFFQKKAFLCEKRLGNFKTLKNTWLRVYSFFFGLSCSCTTPAHPSPLPWQDFEKYFFWKIKTLRKKTIRLEKFWKLESW